VAEYRLYCLDGAGQIAGAPELVAAESDEQALAAARALNKSMRCELWLGTRLVAQIPAAAQR
jgi:hypothetical protein